MISSIIGKILRIDLADALTKAGRACRGILVKSVERQEQAAQAALPAPPEAIPERFPEALKLSADHGGSALIRSRPSIVAS